MSAKQKYFVQTHNGMCDLHFNQIVPTLKKNKNEKPTDRNERNQDHNIEFYEKFIYSRTKRRTRLRGRRRRKQERR